MSGLLGKLAGQVSGQQSGQPSEGSSGLVHKVTDAITGQKHPQDGQGYPPTYGSNQEGRPYPSDTKFTFRELWPVHPHRSIRTKSLICQGTEKVIMVSPKTRIPTAIATKMDTVVTAIGMTALEAMADDTTLVIPLTATRVTTEAMALIPHGRDPHQYQAGHGGHGAPGGYQGNGQDHQEYYGGHNAPPSYEAHGQYSGGHSAPGSYERPHTKYRGPYNDSGLGGTQGGHGRGHGGYEGAYHGRWSLILGCYESTDAGSKTFSCSTPD
ncbi:hypothetical protein N7468_002983 [Penicillium chermesinum]|uniref:Uncharacterized protein n=1 Tax=Penicillium chermesinum TaxID=63820 RepID=A0A9W9P5S0_9EURO|nr:uncharacterized protein N7468_002983 [Penicillium chermesinum]KAJ5238364.1 hypothetical protein N7468_002983 [Penicillium chermesinum]